jgi:hypothetical protein
MKEVKGLYFKNRFFEFGVEILLQAVFLLFARSLYFSMRSSLVCLTKKEYILYDNIDNIKEITEEKNMNCYLTNLRKIIYWCVLHI